MPALWPDPNEKPISRKEIVVVSILVGLSTLAALWGIGTWILRLFNG